MKNGWEHYFTQFLSEHGNFNAKLHKFHLKNDLWCQTFGDTEEETAWHVLAGCPQFKEECTELNELWRDAPVETRTEVVSRSNFHIFVRTALKIAKKKRRQKLITSEDKY